MPPGEGGGGPAIFPFPELEPAKLLGNHPVGSRWQVDGNLENASMNGYMILDA